ncbi:MAG TPA: hypothetical protein VEY92_02850 [Pseudoxanthomonas sp.]|nr:hypothetical protein [Pseudoxanthomonas sp.]
MTDFVFDDYARTTLAGARTTQGKTPSPQQLQQVIDYLKSPGSGPDGSTSYADYVARKMQAHPPKLGPGMDYVGFSGVDASGTSNFKNAMKYAADVRGKAGIIGDTPWGTFVEHAQTDPEFGAIEGKFKAFMKANGIEPFNANYRGALKDMMWNAGSPEYFENAIAAKRPIVAFVENAPPGRGFSNFELTTALKHPDAVINGYPVSAFGSDPLGFASKSAAEFQQLERAIAQAATVNSGNAVSIGQVRSNLRLIEGYDAVNKTLFNQSIDAFKSLNFDEMAATRSAWVASRAGVAPALRIGTATEAPERVPRMSGEPGTPRGPPTVAEPPLTAARGAAEAVPEVMPKGLSPSGKLMLKGAGTAGIALMAYDFVTTGHRVIELRSQGNVTGADSAATHFIGRSAGGIVGGFLAGAGYGLLVGSGTGPGVIATGLVGGVIGTYAGEKWAEKRDNDKIYTQIDGNGNEWSRNPNDPKGSWTRSADTQQIKVAPGAASAAPGQDVKVTPKTDSDGDAVYKDVRYIAAGNLARRLNYQSANASYELGLANPPAPQNPYSLPSRDHEIDRYARDPATGTWMAIHSMPLEHGMVHTWSVSVSAAEAAELDRTSSLILAQNAANTPAAVAARYQIAYNQFGWNRGGPVPDAIQRAAGTVGTLQASDGNTYTRGADGEWAHDGWLYDSKAEGSIRSELNATYQSQQAGLADMAVIAQYAKEHPQPERDGVREMVADLYRTAGVLRTEAELDAATAAVKRDHAHDGLGTHSFSLKLLPDPATNTYGPNSPIATFADDGDEHMVIKSVTTAEEIEQVRSTDSFQTSTPTPATMPSSFEVQPKTSTLQAPISEPAPPQHQGYQHRASFSPSVAGDQEASRDTAAVVQPQSEKDAGLYTRQAAQQQAFLAQRNLGQQLSQASEQEKERQDDRNHELARENERSPVQTHASAAEPNPWEQTEIGQRLSKIFDAVARGDDKEISRLAHEHAQTTEFKEWDAWGQENYRQLQLEQQRQQDMQQQQSRGFSR